MDEKPTHSLGCTLQERRQELLMKARIKNMTLKELLQAWSFDWGMKYPCPYIWFGWWLITFDPDALDTLWSYINTIEIAFMPD